MTTCKSLPPETRVETSSSRVSVFMKAQKECIPIPHAQLDRLLGRTLHRRLNIPHGRFGIPNVGVPRHWFESLLDAALQLNRLAFMLSIRGMSDPGKLSALSGDSNLVRDHDESVPLFLNYRPENR